MHWLARSANCRPSTVPALHYAPPDWASSPDWRGLAACSAGSGPSCRSACRCANLINRRDFLLGLGGAALSGCAPSTTPLPPGDLLGMAHVRGHRLRSGNFPSPSRIARTGVIIVGGGIAGLSAAWALDRAGFTDFALLDLEDSLGGNARAGQSAVCDYPLGAHYMPLPPREATLVRSLLAELDVLQGAPDAERPSYDERYLCATPQERLYRDGLGGEGVLPQRGLSADERAQHQRFGAAMTELKQAFGSDGRKVFAIPMALSSRDEAWRHLDRQTFREWLLAQGYTAPTLHWLANYACRDDYGTDYAQTSAWAGLHYFASRQGEAANAAPDTVLTAPDGNAWLARGLAAPLGDRLHTGALCWRLQRERHQVVADVFYPARGESVRHLAADL